MNFDALITELGGFGRYQIFQFLLLSLVYMLPAMQNFSSIFTAGQPQLLIDGKKVGDNTTELCSSRIEANLTTVTNNASAAASVHPAWTFDQSVFQRTIISRFDLVCSQKYLASLSVTLYMAGLLIGSSFYGCLADRIGRLKALLLCGFNTSLASIIAPFCPLIPLYICFRFLVGIGAGGLIAVTFTLLTENAHTQMRTTIGLLINIGWCSGILYLTLVAYLLRDYVYIELAIGIPAILTLMAFVFLQESPRWLLATGRTHRADRVCRKIAQINQVHESSLDLVTEIVREGDKDFSESSGSTEDVRLMDLLRMPGLRKANIIIMFQFLIVSLVYYGLSLGVGDLAGNVYLNVAIGALIEFPANVLSVFLARHFGRVKLLFTCYFGAGIVCLGAAAMYGRPGFGIPILVTCMMGRVLVIIAFIVQMLYIAEFSPTVVRTLSVGMGSTWARVGGMIAPQIELLKFYWNPLPLIVYGSLPILAALFTLLLPETNKRPSPDTLEEGEAFVRGVDHVQISGRPDQNNTNAKINSM